MSDLRRASFVIGALLKQQIAIDEHLPKRLGGYATLELLSCRGFRIAVLPAFAGIPASDDEAEHRPGVLVIAKRLGMPELRAAAVDVEGAAADIYAQAWAHGLPGPEEGSTR